MSVNVFNSPAALIRNVQDGVGKTDAVTRLLSVPVETARDEAPVKPGGLERRSPSRRDWRVCGIAVFLLAVVWGVFGQTAGHEFVNYDDGVYVYENPVVQKGLTWAGVRWALTFGEIGHWHPLTWISHLLDYRLYGLNAGGHHLTSVVVHAATAILLFRVLREMTGRLWRSAFVSVVFAIHPLRVESVAWVSERKDVLAAFFFVLTLGTYVRYVNRRSAGRYAVVMLTFALGLLSKNMLVTLPFVLLLLDYWPLRGWARGTSTQTWRVLVAEKIPLLLLASGSCVATALVPETVPDIHRWSLALRLENAALSYVTYVWQMFCPTGLTCCYPGPTDLLPWWKIIAALALLAGVSAVACVVRKRHPYLTVGWLWYLGMLVPAIGLVQISYYAHADRYTYLPHIGLYVALTWLAAELGANGRARRRLLVGAGAVVVPALIATARMQTAHWRNTEALWNHALACDSANEVAHFNLGTFLLHRGRVDEAIAHFQRAVVIVPDDEEAHGNLGVALAKKGRVDEAAAQYRLVLQIKPADPVAHHNLGNLLLAAGQPHEALVHFQAAVAHRPTYAEAWVNLGGACLQIGRAREAQAHFRRALEIEPEQTEAENNLAWLLATSPDAAVRDGAQAVALAERANRRTGTKDANLLDTLAAAYAESGRFDDALACVQHAIALAEAADQPALVGQLKAKRRLYADRQPLREERK